MAKGLFVVQTSPSDNKNEAEFNEWYNTVHLGDVLKSAGFKSARRFKKIGDGGEFPYLAIYEVEADDIGKAFEGMMERAQRGEIPLNDVLSMEPPPIPYMYEEIFEVS